MPNLKQSKSKAVQKKSLRRIQRRVFGLVYDQTTLSGQDIVDKLCKSKWGVYQGFSYKHYTDKTKTSHHIHIGVILRNQNSFFMNHPKMLEYFQIEGARCGECRPSILSNIKGPKSLQRKLAYLYHYANNTENHKGQILGEQYIHGDFKTLVGFYETTKKQPSKVSAKDQISDLIRSGKSLTFIEDMWLDTKSDPVLARYIAQNYDKISREYELYTTLVITRRREKEYEADTKKYYPFQKASTKLLDIKTDRHIFAISGDRNIGKTEWTKTEDKRRDTLVIPVHNFEKVHETVGSLWDPLIHKRLIFALPAEMLVFQDKKEINNYVRFLRMLEALKDTKITKTKYKICKKFALDSPRIVVIGNEPLEEMQLEQSDRIRNYIINGDKELVRT